MRSLQKLSRYSLNEKVVFQPIFYSSIRCHIPIDWPVPSVKPGTRPGFKEEDKEFNEQRMAPRNLRREQTLYLPGGPFQFSVRSDESIRRQDQSKLFPHYECMKDRITMVPSFITKDMDQSRHEVIKFYRKVMRLLPGILMDYSAWHVSCKQARVRVALEFRKNSHIRDSRVVDKLRIKGEQEIQSYKLLRYHLSTVYKFLTPEEQINPVPNIVRSRQKFADSDFLAAFYSGNDGIA